MASDLPDVTDPDIRAMVLRDHEPEEIWLRGGDSPQLLPIRCATCWQHWPCPAITAAREADG